MAEYVYDYLYVNVDNINVLSRAYNVPLCFLNYV